MNKILPLDHFSDDIVAKLLDDAFGADRHLRTAYRIREGMPVLPALSFGYEEEGTLVGSIQCWPIALTEADGTVHKLVLVGPVAVSPSQQRGGIGRKLFQTMLDVAVTNGESREGYDALVLIGDPEYYGRFFGFTDDATAQWEVPGPVERRRLLARLLSPRLIGKAGMLGPRH